jgi:hypothetical protein
MSHCIALDALVAIAALTITASAFASINPGDQ